jgi:hypothetical protein
MLYFQQFFGSTYTRGYDWLKKKARRKAGFCVFIRERFKISIVFSPHLPRVQR